MTFLPFDAHIDEDSEQGWQPAFPAAEGRFDQKNEMFKRSIWEEAMQPLAQRFYGEVGIRDRPGYRKVDYAARNGAWNLEWGAAFGNSRSNYGLYAWEGLPEKIRHYMDAGGPVTEGPNELSRMMKKIAGLYGADLVGVTPIHPSWVYSHEFNLLSREHYPLELPPGVNTAIVVAVAMDYEGIRATPTGVAGAATGVGYSRMAFTANLLAAFIRGLGYRALPCGNDTALSVPLAMAAGLGEFSRMGLLVTQPFGPRVRLCKVLTDLPLASDTYRPFGVARFCESCKKCAEQCPSRAIPSGPMTTEGPSVSNQHGVRKWYVDAEKCFSFWSRNRMDCAVCIRVCPFNKKEGRIHDLARGIIRRTGVFDRLLVRGDDLLGYGRPMSADEYWGVSSHG